MTHSLLPMRTIRVHYDDGEVIVAKIRATIPKCVSMFLNSGSGPSYARAIEFLDRNQYHDHNGNVHVIKRVYSISDAYMKRYDLFNRYRFTENVYIRDKWVFAGELSERICKNDAGYLLECDQFEHV